MSLLFKALARVFWIRRQAREYWEHFESLRVGQESPRQHPPINGPGADA